MENASNHLEELDPLLDGLVDQGLTVDEHERLAELLRGDAVARRRYVRFMTLHARLETKHVPSPMTEETNRGEIPSGARGLGTSVPSDVLSDVSARENIPRIPDLSVPHFSAPLFTTHALLFSYLIAAMVLGVGMLIGWAWKLPDAAQVVRQSTLPSSSSTTHYPLSTIHSSVGRITDAVDCHWADSLPSPSGRGAGGEGSLRLQSPVHLRDRFALASGLMEITYDTGAKVIVQGPAVYEVDSASGGFLSVGKLTARVEKREERREGEKKDREGSQSMGHEAQSRDWTAAHSDVLRTPYSVLPAGPSPLSSLLSPLFSVRTPTAVVTDLGTEFGVEVTQEGYTVSHVFRGSVRVQMVGGDGNPAGPGQVLYANESARVEQANGPGDGNVITVAGSAAKQTEFVREIPKRTIKRLDLVDVVAGGDGFSGRRDRGIDPTTGRITGVQPDNRDLQGEYQYHRVDGIPMVDGVFIPDGSKGPVQIDSAGHVFPDCPTTDNCSWAYIWAGGRLPEGVAMLMSATLAGVDYSSPEHFVLTMHANKGITFDLDAVRRGNPDCEVLRFRAVTGNTEPLSRDGAVVSADIWVLVDGEVRFRRREFNYYSGAAPIVVPLHAKDRFLTLAVTDSGNSFRADQVIFGDPQLEMASRSKTK